MSKNENKNPQVGTKIAYVYMALSAVELLFCFNFGNAKLNNSSHD